MEPAVQNPGADPKPQDICPACHTSLEFGPCRCGLDFLTSIAQAYSNHFRRLREARREQEAQRLRSKKVRTIFLVLLASGLLLGAGGHSGVQRARGLAWTPFHAPFYGYPQKPHLFRVITNSLAAPIHSSWKESHVPATRSKQVLEYLAVMENFCRRSYRHDLEHEYREAWETAAFAIFGQLPPRRQSLAAAPACVLQVKRVPRWRQEMLAKPMRRITMHVDDYEVLECGHILWQPAPKLPGESIAKHRRCPECAKQTKFANNKEGSGLGATASASAGSYGEAAPCTEIAAAIDSRATRVLSRRNGPSVASSTYNGLNAATKHPDGDYQPSGKNSAVKTAAETEAKQA